MVHAGPNDGSGTQTKEGLKSAQSRTTVQPAPNMDSLSKRNKAMLQQSEAARKRREQIQSSGSGTIPNKASMSKRAKAKKDVADQSKKRQDLIRSENSITAIKQNSER